MRRSFLLAALALGSLSLSGCGSGGSTPANSQGTSGFSPSSLTFASTSVGSSATAQTLTFTNGSSAATVTGVVLSGSNALDFSQTNTCVGTLAANASCSITVTFTPTSAGTRTATVALVESSGTPPYTTLTGTATAAPAPLADLEPQNGITFGSTVVNNAATSQQATLSNTGTAALTISSVAFTATNMGDFSQTNNCGTSLASSSTCTITVNFTPTTTGARSALLTVTDNSSNGTTQSISVGGTGVASAVPVASLSPTTLSFTSGAAQVVTLSNTGASAMNITGITLTGANASSFAQTNTCGASLSANASCTISVTFSPSGAGSFSATLNVADNAAGSPQTVTITGTAAPVATLSTATLTFTQSSLNTTTAAQSVTLTNTGTASLTGISLSLSGTNATSFAQTNTCASTLAVNANCTISVTFTPTASGTATAAVSIADSATGSPQSVTLTGYGPGSSTLTQSLVIEPTGGFSSIYSLIAAATKTIDMTMYELTDTTATADLVAAGKAGITVRVILDTNGEKSNNTTAYNTLNGATNVSVTWANTSFAYTHEKSIIIDAAIPAKAQAGIFTANLSSQYYASSRDFLLYENDPNDIAAMETTFNSDFTNGQTCAGAKSCTYSPSGYTPPTGDDLVWSPTNARTAIVGVINNATKTLVLDQEEMFDTGMAQALIAAAQRGVSVKCAVTTADTTASLLSSMKAAGVSIAEYPGSGTELYIHAKIIVADYGLGAETAFLGSENFSSGSLGSNRELGLILTDATSTTSKIIISTLNTTLQSDVACLSDSSCAMY